MDEVLGFALERPLQPSPHPAVPEVTTKFEAEQDQELTN
jgi:hypothetical protein